ncbi:hypothetical protein EYF80_005827 [Liparis tanakae]|uniref:Uncharacterized protein n=1 Tax=Liparis tanakae TaxID=230148 RepID=A0A4Z2J1A3_9TELE|nr:hypothetical protein EYF80_005827 [Liparis tanakae]
MCSLPALLNLAQGLTARPEASTVLSVALSSQGIKKTAAESGARRLVGLVPSLGGHGDAAGEERQQSELHHAVRLLQRLGGRPGRKPRRLDSLDVLGWEMSYKGMRRREERGWRWGRGLSKWSGREEGGARDFLP